ncbi:hypothetical protein K504DRAFT_300243 [Pleomassaria siparia CBS 279.74]|uniref:Secreted protein n=1 Tax=Pleomassaria siparia CBS 279.74 TaxID=1314801 RepID=A0A6G1K5L5_9PLEO|nr:hypothetical protein K504DRAFT_300243 [Pleomassaria siparia CBS 279.74]
MPHPSRWLGCRRSFLSLLTAVTARINSRRGGARHFCGTLDATIIPRADRMMRSSSVNPRPSCRVVQLISGTATTAAARGVFAPQPLWPR